LLSFFSSAESTLQAQQVIQPDLSKAAGNLPLDASKLPLIKGLWH